MNTGVLVDTNAFIFARLSDPIILEILNSTKNIYFPVIVIGELKFGFLKGSKTDLNNKFLEAYLNQDQVHILPVTDKTSSVYALIKIELRKSGRPIPENDLWIAAIALENNLPLVTRDSHFSFSSDLVILG